MDPINHSVSDQGMAQRSSFREKGKRWFLPSLQPTQILESMFTNLLLQEIYHNLQREAIVR